MRALEGGANVLPLVVHQNQGRGALEYSSGYSGHYLKRHGMYDGVPSIQKLSVAAILAVALEIVTALGLFASVSAPG